jgi:uncharacterized protein (DUF58 family)
MLLKLFEEEEDLSIYVLLDCSGSMAYGDNRKFNHARKLAAALAYVGLANLDRVALLAISTKIEKTLPTTRGKGRIFRIFDFLRSVTPGGETAIAEAVKVFTAQQKRRGIAIVLSDLYDPEGFERGINAIRYRKYEPIVVHVIDPADADPGARGDVTLVDVETDETRELTLTDPLVKLYREEHAKWRKEIDDFCKTRMVPYVTAEVNQPFEEQVLRLFKRLAIVE